MPALSGSMHLLPELDSVSHAPNAASAAASSCPSPRDGTVSSVPMVQLHSEASAVDASAASIASPSIVRSAPWTVAARNKGDPIVMHIGAAGADDSSGPIRRSSPLDRSDDLSARAFGSLQHDVDGGSLAHQFNWRLFGSATLLLSVFIVCSLVPKAMRRADFSTAAQVIVACTPMLFTLIALLSIHVPLYDAMVHRCCSLRVPPCGSRVLCRLMFSFLWFRPIWTWTPPYLTGLDSQREQFRSRVKAMLLQHAADTLDNNKRAFERHKQNTIDAKIRKRPGLAAGPLTLHSCSVDVASPSSSPSPSSLPFLSLRDPCEVMLHRRKELEEFELAATGGYFADEAPTSARPLFLYRSMLENGKLVRSLIVGWSLFGVLLPVLTAAHSAQGDIFFVVVENVAFTVLTIASAILTVTAGFWPTMQTAAIVRRNIDQTAAQMPMARWFRAQSLEYDRLSIKHASELNGTRVAAMLSFLAFGAFMFAALNWCIVKSNGSVDYMSLIHSAYFWVACILLFAIILVACGVTGELVLADYHAVVDSARLRLSYFTAILRPHALLQQMEEMKRYATDTIKRAEDTEAAKRLSPDDSPLPRRVPYDNLMPVSEARTFLAQLSSCSTVLDRLQLSLRSWMESRMFVQRVDCNFQMQGASWLIGVLVLCSVFGFIFFLAFGFALKKGDLFADPSILLILIVAIGAGLMAVVEILAILRIFDATKEQKKRIAQMHISCCYRFEQLHDAQTHHDTGHADAHGLADSDREEAPTLRDRLHPRDGVSGSASAVAPVASALPPSPSAASSCSCASLPRSCVSVCGPAPPMKRFLSDLGSFLESHDAPPTVLGFSVTPTFMQIMQGYLLSAATTVGATIVAKLA